MAWHRNPDAPSIEPMEAKAIIDAADQDSRPYCNGERWGLLFRVLWYSGRRIGEVLAMMPAMVGDGSMAYLPEKRKDPVLTTCYLPAELCAALKRYCVRLSIRQDRPVFPVTRQAADLALRRYAQRGGITRHVHLHMFRAGHARYMARGLQELGLDSGTIAGAIKQSLNHLGWKTALTYLEPSKAEVRELQRNLFERKRERDAE